MERRISANSLIAVNADREAELHRNRLTIWREGFDKILQTAPQTLGLPPEDPAKFPGLSRFGQNNSVITANRQSHGSRVEFSTSLIRAIHSDNSLNVDPSSSLHGLASSSTSRCLGQVPNDSSERNGNHLKKHVVPVKGVPREVSTSKSQDNNNENLRIPVVAVTTNIVAPDQIVSTPKTEDAVIDGSTEVDGTVLEQMMHEFDQQASIGALFNNLGSPGWILLDEFNDVIVKIVSNIQTETSEKLGDAYSESSGELFRHYAGACAVVARGYNDMREITCPIIDKKIQETSEVIEHDFGYNWLEKTVEDIQAMYLNGEDPDTLSIIRRLGGGLDFYYRSMKSERVNLVCRLIAGLKSYETKMCNLLDTKVCVVGDAGLKLVNSKEHVQELKDLRNQLEDDPRLSDKITQVTEEINDNIRRKNEDRLHNETLIARKAGQHSVSKYCDFMERKLDKAIIASIDLKKLHENVANVIVESFIAVPNFVYTQPWEEKCAMLKQHMGKEFEEFARKNETNIKLKDAEQESAITECLMKFRISHMKLLSEDMEGEEFHAKVQKLADQCSQEFETMFTGFDRPAISRLQARINECIDSKRTEFPFVPISLPGACAYTEENSGIELCDVSSNHLSYPAGEISSPEEEIMSPKLVEQGLTSPCLSSTVPHVSDSSSKTDIITSGSIASVTSNFSSASTSSSSTSMMHAKRQTKILATSTNFRASRTKIQGTPSASTSTRPKNSSSAAAAPSTNATTSAASKRPKSLSISSTSALPSNPSSSRPKLPTLSKTRPSSTDSKSSKPALVKKNPASTNITEQSKAAVASEKNMQSVNIDRSTKPFGRITLVRKPSVEGTLSTNSPSNTDPTTLKSLSPAPSPKVQTSQASPSQKIDQDPLVSPKIIATKLPYSNAGVGIFFTESQVFVSVKVNEKEETFSMNPILYFVNPSFGTPYLVDSTLEEAKIDKRINVYNSLTVPKYYLTAKKFWYEYNYEHFWSEEIIGLFLLKLWKQILKDFGIDISANVIAIALPTFVTSACRQRLKTALELVGLKKSVFVQATTAIGISHSLDNSNSQYEVEEHGLAIYVRRSHVDVALIKYTGNKVETIAVESTKTFDESVRRKCAYIEPNASISEYIIRAITSALSFARIREDEVKSCRTVVDIASLGPKPPNWDRNAKFRSWFQSVIVNALPEHVRLRTFPIDPGMMKGLVDISMSRTRKSADRFHEVFSCDFEISNIDGVKTNKIRLVSRNTVCQGAFTKILAHRLGSVNESSPIRRFHGGWLPDELEMRLCATDLLKKDAPNAEVKLVINQEGIISAFIDLKTNGQDNLNLEIAGRWKKDARVMELANRERIEKRIKAIYNASSITESYTSEATPSKRARHN